MYALIATQLLRDKLVISHKVCQVDVYSIFVVDKPVRMSSFLRIKFQGT